jgi:hypothetical protein
VRGNKNRSGFTRRFRPPAGSLWLTHVWLRSPGILQAQRPAVGTQVRKLAGAKNLPPALSTSNPSKRDKNGAAGTPRRLVRSDPGVPAVQRLRVGAQFHRSREPEASVNGGARECADLANPRC